MNIAKFLFCFSSCVDFTCLSLNVQDVNEKSLDILRQVKEKYGIAGRIESLKISVFMMEKTLNVNVEILLVLMKKSG